MAIPNVGEAEMIKRAFYGKGTTITSSTNATPIVLTVPSGHSFKVNDRVFVSDHATNTNANGSQLVSAVTATTITLSGAVGNGVGGATGTISLVLEAMSLKLYSNNITPGQTDTAGTYTEATFTGYSAKTLTSQYSTVANWGTPSGSNPTAIQYPQQTWSPTTSQAIYGYFVVGSDSTVLLWSEIFASAPKNLQNGDTLNLTPKMQLT